MFETDERQVTQFCGFWLVVLYFYWVVYASVNLAVAIFGMQVRVFTVHILLWKKLGKNNYAYICSSEVWSCATGYLVSSVSRCNDVVFKVWNVQVRACVLSKHQEQHIQWCIIMSHKNRYLIHTFAKT